MNVNVHCGDSYVLIEPTVPEELTKKLSYWHKELKVDPGTRKRTTMGRTRKLYSCTEAIDPQGMLVQRLVTLPGFAHLVRTELRDNGYAVNLIDERTPRPRYDMAKALEGLRDYQLECAYTAVWSGGGIVACPTGWGKTRIIAAIFRAHSREELCYRNTCMCVLVTPGVDLAKKNYRDLVELLPDRDVGLVCTGVKKFSEDIQVVTPESLGHLPLEDAGILAYDEVHTLSYKRAENVLQASKALRYGFSATPSGRFDGGDKVIEGVIGPIIYTKTYAEAIDDGAVVPLRVYWINCPEPPGWRHYATHNANYRHGVWRNMPMHQLVGKIWQRVPDDMQALAMVDKLEHLDHTYPFLGEDTVYMHATKNADTLKKRRCQNVDVCSNKKRNQVYQQLADGTLKRVISTGIYRQGVDFPHLTVLFNLAGIGSEIISGQLPGRTSRVSGDKECGFIIDFWHPWHTYEKRGRRTAGCLLKDDMRREQLYRDMGFEQVWVENVDDVEFQFEESNDE
jgi:superfamily II DNA or RNA helicase